MPFERVSRMNSNNDPSPAAAESVGNRFWYAAGPWAATRLVAAVKP